LISSLICPCRIKLIKPTIKIDYVSDVACPWCAVGLCNLNLAIVQLSDQVNFEVHFHPFELNSNMPVGGQDAIEHLTEKYGLTSGQVKANQANIGAKALEAGFAFHPEGRKGFTTPLIVIVFCIGLLKNMTCKSKLPLKLNYSILTFA
jgi:predicted DsbA family dithiol-disulfide isomerase